MIIAQTTSDPNANSKSWNDTFTGLTMVADSPAAQYLKVGNHLAAYDQANDRWRVYRIYTVDETMDTTSGTNLISADAINLLIWRQFRLKKRLKSVIYQRLWTG